MLNAAGAAQPINRRPSTGTARWADARGHARRATRTLKAVIGHDDAVRHRKGCQQAMQKACRCGQFPITRDFSIDVWGRLINPSGDSGPAVV